MFSARLRLPGTMTTAEKKERVEEMITELGLTNAADTKIGNEEVSEEKEITAVRSKSVSMRTHQHSSLVRMLRRGTRGLPQRPSVIASLTILAATEC